MEFLILQEGIAGRTPDDDIRGFWGRPPGGILEAILNKKKLQKKMRKGYLEEFRMNLVEGSQENFMLKSEKEIMKELLEES